MKILAIRGRNLASLQGNFELDFTSDPLFGCGLFAITGETGAGKSTILDALCLALYGRYPRITGQGSKNKIENSRGEALATSDPRSILRTGCSDAYAQVDLMIDDQLLQASWRVRRAHGKTTGNLLDFERALINLKDKSVLASGKKRVDEEIAQRLKLTYEQFGRTVVLAQNEFDAFLRASDGDRADLLEKITGTELYSKISAKAFEEERLALRDLEDLQKATGFIAVLPDDERAALQELVNSSQKSHLSLIKKGKKTSAALDWYGRHDEAVKRVEDAQKQVKQAEQKLSAAADEKQLLANIDIARSVQGLIDKAVREEQSLMELRKQQSSQQGNKSELKKNLEQAELNEGEHRETYEKSDQELVNAGPVLERALQLDTQISVSQKDQSEREAALDEGKKTNKKLFEQQCAQQKSLKQMGQRLDHLEHAQLQNVALEQVSRRADDLTSLFQNLTDLQKKNHDVKALLAKKQQSNEAASYRLQKNITHIQTMNDQLSKLRTKCDDSANNLQKSRPDEMRLKRDHQSDCQMQLNRLHHHIERVVEQTQVIDEAQKTRTEAQGKATSARQQLQALDTALSDLKSRAGEAKEALTRSKSALSKHVLSLRAQLQSDEPCAVCGSTDHPGHDDKANNELLELMDARTFELAEQITTNERDRSRTQQTLEHAKARIESADDRLAVADNKLARLQSPTKAMIDDAQTAAKLIDLQVTGELPPEILLGHLEELRETLEYQMVDMQKKLMAIQQLEAHSRDDTKQLLALEKTVQTQTKENDALAKSGQVLHDEAREMREHLDQSSAHCKLVLEQIMSIVSGIEVSKTDLEQDPRSVEQFLQKQISRYEQQKQESKQIKADLHKMQGEGAVLAERLEHISAHCAELESQLAQNSDKLLVQKSDRLQLFDGQPVAIIRATLEKAQKRDVKALQSVLDVKREWITRLEEVEKNLVHLEGQIKTTSRSEQKTTKARDAALIKKDLVLEQVKILLAIPDEDTNAMSKRVVQLVDIQTKNTALLADRTQHLKDIEGDAKPKRQRSELRDDLREIEADQAMLMIDLGKNKSTLELDDTALKNRRKLSHKIESVEKKHALWAVMSEAIGSKTGDKFRRFAQGVTLDHLIALANQQLRTINPRYKIERNTIGGLGLQVMDMEMGGEIRSVRSLSGGERFLVSLALALGLSQLDGRASFVDTLMIDEGFGALDARSLDIAIQALESLQSQGRKVGVISHIEALTERIPVQVRVEKQGSGRSHVRVIERGLGV